MRWLALGGALGLAACAAVGPDYSGPPPTTAQAVPAWPAGGAVSAHTRTSEPPAAWWQALGDPVLDGLIVDAAGANYDLRVAVANVEGARAALRAVATRRRPRLDFEGSVAQRRDASAEFALADAEDPLPSLSSGSFGLALAWEIDLFGRVRRSIEAAAAELGSLEALRHAVMTTVIAAVARSYIELRGAQVRLEVAERNVAVQRQTLDLVLLLNAEGAATDLDVARARTQLLSSEATMPSLRAAERAAMNRLTTLTARPPGALAAVLAPPAPVPAMPAFVAVGSATELLRRRADLRAAERALAAAAARIGVATADLYPSVAFGARLGAAAMPLSALDSAGAPFFAVGPTVTWNLFDRAAIHARIAAQDSAAAAGVARFEAAVTQALEEVDSALNAWLNERERRAQLAAARAASRDASRLARLRYREGVEDFLAVLDAERSLLLIEDQLARSDIDLAQNLVSIYLALGGGWQALDAPAYRPYAPSE